MLVLRIDKLLKNKGIDKPYAWLRKLGFNHNTTNKLLSRDHIRVPLKQIEIICKAAWCTPSVLMEWLPDVPTEDIPTHPLQRLRPAAPENILHNLYKLPPETLNEIKEIIKKGV